LIFDLFLLIFLSWSCLYRSVWVSGLYRKSENGCIGSLVCV